MAIDCRYPIYVSSIFFFVPSAKSITYITFNPCEHPFPFQNQIPVLSYTHIHLYNKKNFNHILYTILSFNIHPSSLLHTYKIDFLTQTTPSKDFIPIVYFYINTDLSRYNEAANTHHLYFSTLPTQTYHLIDFLT